MLKYLFNISLLLSFLFYFSSIPLYAADWSDLDEGEHKIYGSEKEEKYPINAFVIEKEEWENHYSFMAFWIFNNTDYPKYTSFRILPFYYNLKSKIDNREKTILPILLGYYRKDGPEKLLVTLPYYSYINEDESERSVLYLFWWGREGAHYQKSYEFFAPILYYHSQGQRKDGKERTSVRISPLFYSYSNTAHTDKFSNYSRTNFSLLHYYKSSVRIGNSSGGEKEEKRTTRWFFPIIPLTYHYTHSEGGHRNFLWFLDYSWISDSTGDTLKRFWLFPIWFWKKGTDGYNHILPPVYVDNRSSNGEYYTHLLPLFMTWKSIDSSYNYIKRRRQNQYKQGIISLAYCSFKEFSGKSGWQGKSESSSFWWPIIPLYYSSSDKDKGSHRNVLWLFDWHKNRENKLSRFWAIPLWFEKYGKQGYRHILPPVYISFKSGSGEYYRHLLPFLYFSWRSINHNSRYLKYEDSLVSPLFCYFDEYEGDDKWAGKLNSTTYWAPILPFLFFRSEDQESGSHTNVLGLFDWSSSKTGSLDRMWIMPLWFDKRGSNGYRHVLPPIYMSFRSSSGYYNHLLPFYVYNRNKNVISSDNFSYSEYFISLIYGSFKEYYDGNKWNGIPAKTKFWFPIVPLFFRSSDKEEGTHTNMALLIDWAGSREGNMERFWFIPFVFHQMGESGYRYYFPFYLRPQGNNEKQGLSFSLFHYHSWSPEKKTMWLLPCLNVIKPEKNEYFIMLLPFFYTWKTEKSSAKVVLPLYYHLKYKDWDASLIIPWSLSYKDKKRSVYINLFGISRSAVLGSLSPELDFDIGTYRGKLYLDTDVSWLYEVVSFSTRLSFTNPFAGKNDEEIDLSDVDERSALPDLDKEIAKPGLSKKKEFDREHSEFFWGWKILFGWMAYEMADTKRHFRLLPLSWFTWDKNSTDSLYTVPFAFLYFKSSDEDSEYFALFPLFVPMFGYQKDRESYKYGFILNLLWIEYDVEEDLNEITVLWPILNWYNSPGKSGWRIFPLFWHKSYKEKENIISRNIIFPLHYSRHERDSEDNVINKFVINPLYYSSQTREDSEIKKTTMFPIVPIYYSSYKKTIFSNRDENHNEKSVEYISDEFSTVLGLYVSNDITTVKVNGEKENDSRFFLLGYYSHISRVINERSFLFGLIKNVEYPEEDRNEFKLFYGLYSTSNEGDAEEMRLLPFYYNYQSPEMIERYLLLGLYWNIDYIDEEDSSLYLLYGIFSSFLYQETEYIRLNNKYSRMDLKKSKWWLFPFYYYSSGKGDEGKRYSNSFHLFWLWYYNSESYVDEEKGALTYSNTLWFPVLPLVYIHTSDSETHWNAFGFIDRVSSPDYSRFFVLPLFYRSEEKGGSHCNVLGIIDWKYDSNESLSRSWFLPVWLWYPGEESHLFIFPILTYFARSPEESTTFILGTYWHSSENYERQNVFYLFDHKRDIQYDSDSYRYLFGTIHYETSPDVMEWDLLFGLLMKYRSYKDSQDYEFEFMKVISTWERDGDYFQSSILPFWYYEEDKDSWSILSPVSLTYLSEDKSGDFDLGLLGLLYYRNNKIHEREDTRAVLGGTLFWERHKPERGYHSFGSLWGILWDYETESETGFKKFTILKGLYKRVVMNGEVKHKFFWIF